MNRSCRFGSLLRCSIHISVAFSITKLQWRSTAFGVPIIFLLFRNEIKIFFRNLIAAIIILKGPLSISDSSAILFSSSVRSALESIIVVDMFKGVNTLSLLMQIKWFRKKRSQEWR
eukprot:NODE_178_length_14069_cov_0.746815.p13 type:complete len:116 gc:universal NODE_178_length_14069_cov_0.746815:6539-6192(-)